MVKNREKTGEKGKKREKYVKKGKKK